MCISRYIIYVYTCIYWTLMNLNPFLNITTPLPFPAMRLCVTWSPQASANPNVRKGPAGAILYDLLIESFPSEPR